MGLLLISCAKTPNNVSKASMHEQVLASVEYCSPGFEAWKSVHQTGSFTLKQNPLHDTSKQIEYAVVFADNQCVIAFFHRQTVSVSGKTYSHAPNLSRISQSTAPPEYLKANGVVFERFMAEDQLSTEIARALLAECKLVVDKDECLERAKEKTKTDAAVLRYRLGEDLVTLSLFETDAYFKLKKVN